MASGKSRPRQHKRASTAPNLLIDSNRQLDNNNSMGCSSFPSSPVSVQSCAPEAFQFGGTPPTTTTTTTTTSNSPSPSKSTTPNLVKRASQFFNRKIGSISNSNSTPIPRSPVPSHSQPLSKKISQLDQANHSQNHVAGFGYNSNNNSTNDFAPVLPAVRIDTGPVPHRRWRDFLSAEQFTSLNLSSKDITFQELFYEIVQTEDDYLRDLRIIHRYFIMPAQQTQNLTIPALVLNVFASITDMIMLHTPLLRDLQARWKRTWPVCTSIADIFLSHTSDFEKYTSYLCNYEASVRVLTKMLQDDSDAFGIFCRRQIARQECRNLTLEAFLLKPIQRLMKYPLFLKNLLDCRDTSHPDYAVSLEAHNGMDAVIRRIEEAKKKHEETERLRTIESKIKGMNKYPDFKLAIPGRTLIYEGSLSLLPASGPSFYAASNSSQSSLSSYSPPTTPILSGATSPIIHGSQISIPDPPKLQPAPQANLYVFLFNDIIIWTKKISRNASGYLYKIIEQPAKVTFVEDTSSPPPLPPLPTSSPTFGTWNSSPISSSNSRSSGSMRSMSSTHLSNLSSPLTSVSTLNSSAPTTPIMSSFSTSSYFSSSSSSRTIFEVTSVHKNKIHYVLSAPSEELKYKWVDCLQNAIHLHTNRSNDEDGLVRNDSSITLPHKVRGRRSTLPNLKTWKQTEGLAESEPEPTQVQKSMESDNASKWGDLALTALGLNDKKRSSLLIDGVEEEQVFGLREFEVKRRSGWLRKRESVFGIEAR